MLLLIKSVFYIQCFKNTPKEKLAYAIRRVRWLNYSYFPLFLWLQDLSRSKANFYDLGFNI